MTPLLHENILRTKRKALMIDNIPLVSIIVPIYKVEKYLPTCIDSIISQTYKNIEILLIDDGSPDNCGRICDEYAVKDNRIRVFHEENKGVSVARNIGLDNANGEWISFIDPDDYIDNDFIEYLVSIMHATRADISYCSYRYLDEEGNILQREKNDNSNNPIKTFTSEESLISLFRKKNDFANYIWNGLFRKSITTYFIEGKRTGQDQDFTIQSLINAKLIARGYQSKYNHILRFTGASSIVLKERMQNGFNTLKNIKIMLTMSNVSHAVFDAFDENSMRLYFSYMDKYCEYNIKDKSVFKELRSGIRKYTQRTFKGYKGTITSFFLGISGEFIYKIIFYFIRKKDSGRTRVLYKGN